MCLGNSGDKTDKNPCPRGTDILVWETNFFKLRNELYCMLEGWRKVEVGKEDGKCWVEKVLVQF